MQGVTRAGASPAPRGETVTRAGASPAPRGETVTRAGASPAPRGETVTRAGASPALRGETVTRAGASPALRGETVTRAGASPALRERSGRNLCWGACVEGATGMVSPDLLARCKQGDRAAFEELVRVTHRRVYSLAYRLVGDRSDAEDVSQEAYLRMFRGLAGFREEAAFETWMHRIVANCAMTH